MRIALIAPPWLPVPPPAYGGSELVIDGLAQGLAATGHEVLLFATGDSPCPVPRGFVYDHACGLPARADRELRHVIRAYEAVRGFDVVHDHTVAGPVYSAQVPGLTVVTTNHGLFDPTLRDVYRTIAGRVPIIAISHAHAATARDLPIGRVIHHGIDVDAMPFGAGAGGYFLFLGRMGRDKGAHRAARIARAAGVPLLIAAKMHEPAERDYFQRSLAPLLGSGIEYVGEVNQDEKLRLLADARALLNPIRWAEPFGLVMVEALACGTPVLTFPEGAAPEIIDHGHTGFMCADDGEMTERIEEVGRLDRIACRTAAQRQFSSERMVADHLAFYQEVSERERVAA